MVRKLVWFNDEGELIEEDVTCDSCKTHLPHETNFHVVLPRESDSIMAFAHKQRFEFCSYVCLREFILNRPPSEEAMIVGGKVS